tara:strand:- start:43 stop:1026 length:984 start_codon:yes stop_codon:yes gene_type:complete
MKNNFIKPNLEDLLIEIKKFKKKNEYDCIVGLSGGVDSAWTLVKVIEMGLKPLAVHMDNGWNTELAQNNIHNLVKKLNVDLYTEVLDWDKYRSLMKSFFMSDVVDIELLYDNAMFAANYFQANKYNVKYILAGTNNSTEGMRIPSMWNWYKYDKKNIKDINSKFEKINLKNYPLFGTFDYIFLKFFKKIKWISFLDYIEYNKEESEKSLINNYNFKPYKYKHYESFFTKFYQSYILPKKFNIDKRKLHLSSLIVSNQITRKEALKTLESKPYNEDTIEDDINYFLKKMNWEIVDLENYMERKRKKHSYYKTELPMWESAIKIYKFFK